MNSDNNNLVGIWTEKAQYVSCAQTVASDLNLSFSNNLAFILELNDRGWQLKGQYPDAPKNGLRVDFTAGKNSYRRRNPGVNKQPIAKAVGLRYGKRPTILDCTAGLGGDSFVLTSLGCSVWLTERHPVIRVLLVDGIKRAKDHPTTRALFENSMFLVGDTLDTAKRSLSVAPEIIYMDPMYPKPPSKRTALVKKDMQLLRRLIGPDSDATQWLNKARQWASKVVVKRPNWAEPLAPDIHNFVESKNHRFDVYLGQRDSCR